MKRITTEMVEELAKEIGLVQRMITVGNSYEYKFHNGNNESHWMKQREAYFYLVGWSSGHIAANKIERLPDDLPDN